MSEMPHADSGVRYRLIDTRGSRHIALSPLYFGVALAKLAWLAALGRVDIIHANISARGSTLRKLHVAVVAHVFGIPFILHLHDGRFDQFYRDLPRFARDTIRWMFQTADHIVVLSSYWKGFISDDIGVARHRIDVICNAVRQSPHDRRSGRQQTGPLHLLFLGRLWEPKGVSDLLDALARPEVSALDWRATLAGDGDPGPYERQACRLGLSSRVAFPGWQGRAAVDRLLSEAAVLVLPSHVEGLPMVILEALAHGVPVVATNVGSIPEYLTHGYSALLVAPRDVDGLSQALVTIIESSDLRARLATQGEQVVRKHFDVATTAKSVASIYRRVARPNRQPGL